MFRNLFSGNSKSNHRPPEPNHGKAALQEEVSEAERLTRQSEALGIPVKKNLLEELNFDSKLDVPIQYFKRMGLVPLSVVEGTLTVAINDPANFQAADELCRKMGCSGTKMVLSPIAEIHSAINLLFDQSTDDAEKMVQARRDRY